MENASKALIIAGAILLAILIISLGIMIYQQAAGVADGGAIDEVAVSSFNQKFTQYEGTRKRGAQVNALLEQIKQSNITYQDDTTRQITVVTDWDNGPNGKITTGAYAKASTGSTYTVETTPDGDTGYITTITITTTGSGGGSGS